MSNYVAFGFGMRAFKRFPELIPLCVIIGGACVGACSFMGYALYTKPDVRINKSDAVPPWEKVRATECRKMVTLNQKYIPIPELEKLREEIGSYKL
ncbi:normal mucosa of esophagus-specific gene 1 protein-like [Haliotis cracherodii]|uniref:normal mucosa of esophagus-specific gene 1 protein-like n=1 Tax=Haliotis rufescens TaxID=6454 RepID=UPI001EAFAA7D|nr:normal mucosa of esophagus-specific gene 1 protein-like [Haliotis rufescens]